MVYQVPNLENSSFPDVAPKSVPFFLGQEFPLLQNVPIGLCGIIGCLQEQVYIGQLRRKSCIF